MNTVKEKKNIISSLLWKLAERSGTQGIQFIVQIILARLLLPEDYGILAIVIVFVLLANVFVHSGFNTALIQKKNADDTDFSSVFFLSLLISILLYVLLFSTAPLISLFFKEPLLTPVLRTLSIILFFGVFNSIQNAVIARNMAFKKLFFSSIGSIIISGTVGIVMAYMEFGVWALVAQQIISAFSITVILWFTVKWRPKLIFSYKRVKILFSYGWKLLVSALIDTLDKDLRSLIIGKIYSPAMLGFYQRGQQFPQLLVTNINGSIQSVMLPVLSARQDDKQKVKHMVRRSIMTSSFIIFPMMIGLAVIAEPLIMILLTDKWLPAVPFVQVFSIIYALWPIHTTNLQAINAIGRSDIFLKLEIIKKLIGLVILIISIQFGVYAIAIGLLVSDIIALVINAYPNSKLINYSYKEQFKDISPSLIIAIVMGSVIYAINLFNFGYGLIMLAQIIIGFIFYIAIAYFLKLESLKYLITTIKEMKK